MTVWNYSVTYDEERDEFFAMVDDGAKPPNIVFTIDTTPEIIHMIKTGVMNHIDDTDGLEEFLKKEQYIGKDDCILIEEYALW